MADGCPHPTPHLECPRCHFDLMPCHVDERPCVCQQGDVPPWITRLTRERDEALADAWRYRWLKGRNPTALATVAWCCPEACKYPDPDRAIDAAMAAEERDA